MAEVVISLAIKKIAIAIGNEAINQASTQLKKFVVQRTELQGSMGRMRMELRVIHDFLCQMDIRYRQNQIFEGWLEEVRKVVHAIEDIVDDYLHLVGEEPETGWCSYLKKGIKKPKTTLLLNNIASMIKQKELDLGRLSAAKDRWVPMPSGGNITDSSYIVQRSQIQARISSSLGEGDLVGIEGNREIVTQWVMHDALACSVIVLQGMGGLGKTTLAANVYKREQKNFDCYAWVSISRTYCREEVLKKLTAEFSKDKQKDLCTEETLKSFLEHKRYLIVLDDVWKPEHYTSLSGELIPNRQGSRIIITTRYSDVAQLASPGLRLELKYLSEDQSWELFCKKAFPGEPDHECPPGLEALSRKILSKCGGLPLAIVSIGSLLYVREKTTEEWKRINDQLTWELANNSGLSDVSNILYLSFIYLPTYLKSCFLYCSLFPEDHVLRRSSLIKLWIAEGFIEVRGESTLEEVAAYYLNELVRRSMLQVIKRNSFGRIKACKMHDIVRELALDLCQRESFGVTYWSGKAGSAAMDTRRLFIQKCTDDIQSNSTLHRARSIVSFDKGTPSSMLLPSIAEKSKYLSVLELCGLPIEKVPSAIGDLFNLRHLGLRDSKVKLLPKSIKKLSNLLTLDLSRSNIQELPRGISKLKKLRNLYAQKIYDPSWRDFRSIRGVCIPKGLGNLKDLRTLQAVEAQQGSVRDLGKLTQLRTLRVLNVKGKYCDDLCRSLLQMEYLSTLSIYASDENEVLRLDGLTPPPVNICKLHLVGQLAPGTLDYPLFQSAGKNLYEVYLSWSQLTQDHLLSLSQLSNLTLLSLNRAYLGERLTFYPGWFPRLKELRLRNLPNLKTLEIQEGAMKNLEILSFSYLDKLIEIRPAVKYFTSLREVFSRRVTAELQMWLRG